MLHVEAGTRLGAFDLDVRFEVAAGSCLALAGPSGAGKTTVLRIIAGLVAPDRGTITAGAERWVDTTAGLALPPERRRCGYVFQDYALFPHLTAVQNVAFGLRGSPRAKRRDRAVALLERFGIASLADAGVSTMSGGERQRVAVARALARDPSVLLLDEPLSALDPRSRAHAGRELKATLRDAAVPSVLVTHDFTEAAMLGDEIAVIDAGRIIQRGPAEQLAARPATPFVADFTGAVVLLGTAHLAADGLMHVTLDGGGTLVSTDAGVGAGPVVATLYPWEITLGPRTPAGGTGTGASGTSAQNGLDAVITSLTTVGNRVRVGLDGGQHFTAEVTTTAAADLALAEGLRVRATFKAAATRLVRR